MKMARALLFVLAAVLLCAGCSRESSRAAVNAPSEEFDAALRRDLRSYFQGAAVAYELLRDERAQGSIAHAKYYLWVRATAPDGQIREGALRVIAVDKTHFEVMDFITADAIRANPDAVEQIFPAPLCPAIRERAHER